MKKAKEIGIEEYNKEQKEKAAILQELLNNYNSGRQKTLFSLRVNLLPLIKLKKIMNRLKETEKNEILSMKEKSAYASELLLKKGENEDVTLKLRKKTNKKKS